MTLAALLAVLVVAVTSEDMEDVFSSTSEMAALARREEVLVARLKEYRDQLEGRMARLRASEPVDGREVEEGGEELTALLAALPKEAQLEGAANGIFLLQETYDLDITALAGGDVRAPRLSTDSYMARRGLEARYIDTRLLELVTNLELMQFILGTLISLEKLPTTVVSMTGQCSGSRPR